MISSETSNARQFVQYVVPTTLAMLIYGVYAVVDGIFLGHFVGADALAAMTVAYPMWMLLAAVSGWIQMGGATYMSLSIGAGEYQRAQRYFENTIGLSVYASLGLIIAAYFICTYLIEFMAGVGQVGEFAADYLWIILLTSPVAVFSMVLAVLVRNDGAPKLSTAMMIAGATTNIFLDYLFIVEFNWGMKGAAWATVLAESVAMIIGFYHFAVRSSHYKLVWRMLKLDLNYVGNILRNGASTFVLQGYLAVIIWLHNRLFLSYGNSLYIAAFAVVGYTQSVFYMVGEGIALGIQPLVSYWHGAKNSERVKTFLNYAYATVVVIALINIAAVFWRPDLIAGIYSDDVSLLPLAIEGFKLHLLALPLEGMLLVTIAYLQAMGKAEAALFVAIGKLIVFVPILLIMPIIGGVTAIWLASPVANTLLFVAVFLWLKWLRSNDQI